MSKRVGGRKMITKYMKATYGSEFDNEETAKEFLIHFHEGLRFRSMEQSEHIIRLESDLFDKAPWWKRVYGWVTLK